MAIFGYSCIPYHPGSLLVGGLDSDANLPPHLTISSLYHRENLGDIELGEVLEEA